MSTGISVLTSSNVLCTENNINMQYSSECNDQLSKRAKFKIHDQCVKLHRWAKLSIHRIDKNMLSMQFFNEFWVVGHWAETKWSHLGAIRMFGVDFKFINAVVMLITLSEEIIELSFYLLQNMNRFKQEPFLGGKCHTTQYNIFEKRCFQSKNISTDIIP